MAWEVPQFSTGTGNQSQVVQQAFSGRPQGQQQGMQGAQQARPVAASSVDANGNVVTTSGQAPASNAMFRQGSVLGTYFPDAQKVGGTDWGAAIGRLMGIGG